MTAATATKSTGNPHMDALIEFCGEPISTYTQAQAIADGALVPLAERFARMPVLMTAAAHADSVAWSDAIEKRKREYSFQDETGRAADVIATAGLGWRTRQRTTWLFELRRVPPTGAGVMARRQVLRATITGQDDGSPCVVIGLPNED